MSGLVHIVMNVLLANILNLFNGNGKEEGFPNARGAKSYDAYQLQMKKLGVR